MKLRLLAVLVAANVINCFGAQATPEEATRYTLNKHRFEGRGGQLKSYHSIRAKTFWHEGVERTIPATLSLDPRCEPACDAYVIATLLRMPEAERWKFANKMALQESQEHYKAVLKTHEKEYGKRSVWGADKSGSYIQMARNKWGCMNRSDCR